MTEVILVDEQDVQTGTMDKMEAHRQALLHRAFSIFIFNSKGELLLQKRAENKYHSGGLWTNTCCSHPQPGETTNEAAVKRLQEEMGFTVPLKKAFDFVYRVAFDNELSEHEFDHVYLGEHDGEVNANPEEVSDHCYQSMDDIRAGIGLVPQKYTEWFKIAFPKLEAYLAKQS